MYYTSSKLAHDITITTDDRWGYPKSRRPSSETDFIDDDSDEISEFNLVIYLKIYLFLLQTHSEEKEEYSLAVQMPKVMEKKLSFVCKQRNIASKATNSCCNLCVLNGPKVQR